MASLIPTRVSQMMHSVNASHLTVGKLAERVASALEKEQRRRGTSLNQTFIDLLGQSLARRRHASRRG
jgi:hypothetical protein